MVYLHAYSQTALLWETEAQLWLNPEDIEADFTRWSVDQDGRLFDVETLRAFEITDLITEAA